MAALLISSEEKASESESCQALKVCHLKTILNSQDDLMAERTQIQKIWVPALKTHSLRRVSDFTESQHIYKIFFPECIQSCNLKNRDIY